MNIYDEAIKNYNNALRNLHRVYQKESHENMVTRLKAIKRYENQLRYIMVLFKKNRESLRGKYSYEWNNRRKRVQAATTIQRSFRRSRPTPIGPKNIRNIFALPSPTRVGNNRGVELKVLR